MKFGFAFGETFLGTQKGSRRKSGSERIRHLLAFYLAGFAVLVMIVGRLVQLQIMEGEETRIRSEENRLKLSRVSAPRGAIYDRNGEVLVRNVPVYKKYELGSKKYEVIGREEAERLRGEGEEVIEDIGREYIFGKSTGHILGYLGEIDEDGLNEARSDCLFLGRGCDYQLGDFVGILGIEKIYEEVLRGSPGGVVEERGVDGSKVRELAIREPSAGDDVTLTIDIGLQRKAVEILGDRRGAVVVSDPTSGEILALASSPGFDANVFNKQIANSGEPFGEAQDRQIEAILNSEDKPLFNRALAGLYPPGSVFKIVTATAALEEGEIKESTEIEDTGEIKIGEFRYGNWYFDQYGRKEGFLNIVGAIKRSNDIFFYRLGEKTGADKIAQWAEKFGLGKLVGLNLSAEAVGVVPSPEWKETFKGERWFLGNTYHFAIGQGDLQTTPLQIHQMASVIASEGKLCKPVLVKVGQVDQVIQVGKGGKCEEVGIGEETLRLVQEGMVEACKPRGTAFPFFNFSTATEASASADTTDGERVACKTGTAQFGDPKDRTHAWFVVYGPSENPEILVTVLLEAAGEGSYQAAPVAKELFSYWFHKRS